MKKFLSMAGFIDPISLITLGFLIVGLVVTTSIVKNPEKLDIRNWAKICSDDCIDDSDCGENEQCYRPAGGCPVCRARRQQTTAPAAPAQTTTTTAPATAQPTEESRFVAQQQAETQYFAAHPEQKPLPPPTVAPTIKCSSFGSCYPNNYTCEKEFDQLNCGSGSKCGIHCLAPPTPIPTQTPTPAAPSQPADESPNDFMLGLYYGINPSVSGAQTPYDQQALNFLTQNGINSLIISAYPGLNENDILTIQESAEQALNIVNQYIKKEISFGGIIAHNTYITGNVGIGRTNPTTKLYVNGVATADSFYDAQSASYYLNPANAGGNSLLVAGNVGIGTTGPGAKLEIKTTGAGSAGLKLTTSGAGQPLIFQEELFGSDPDWTISNGAGELMRFYNHVATVNILNKLLVGATTQPLNTLDISGSVAIGTYSGVNTAPANGMIISGNVGIGTTGPGADLEVVGKIGAAATALKVTSDGNADDKVFHFIGNAGLEAYQAVMMQTGNVGIGYTNPGTAKLAINGNVGIGTVSPGSKLQVNGNAVIGYSASTAGPANGLAISGNVGIGTTNPLQKLHVEGQCVTGDSLLPIIVNKLASADSQDASLASETTDPTAPATPEEELGSSQPAAANQKLTISGQNSKIQPNRELASSSNRELELTRIDQIKGGEEVLSLNEETGKIEPHTIKGLLDMGVQPVYKLTTADGKTIRTTGNHPYLVKEATKKSAEANLNLVHLTSLLNGWPDNLVKSFNIWTKVIYLKAGDEIAVARLDPLRREASSTRLAEDLLTGTGANSSNQGKSNNNQNVNQTGSIEKFNQGTIHNLSSNLDASNIANVANENEYVKRTTASATDLTPKTPGKSTTEPIAAAAKSDNTEEITFNLPFDNLINNNSNTKDIRFVKIASIEYAGEEQVWDIEVEDTHNFVANGIIAHNTYITGNVGIGTTGPTSKLGVVGGGILTDSFFGFSSVQQVAPSILTYINAPRAVNLGFHANGAEAMTIDSSGNVGIGTTGPTYQLQLSTDSAAKPTSNTWTIASDARIKNVVSSYNKGLTELLKINPIIYTYKENNALGIIDPGEHVGIIAQEVQKIFPEAITTDDQGYLHFNSDALSWASINAIKELNTKIDDNGDIAGVQIVTDESTPEEAPSGPPSEVKYRLTDTAGEIIDRIGAFAEVVVANIKAGSIETKNLIADQITLQGQSLKSYITSIVTELLASNTAKILAPTIETEVLTTKFISPLADGEITIKGPVLIEADATVSGTLYADKIKSSTIDIMRQKIEELVAGLNQPAADPPDSGTIDINTLNTLYELLNSQNLATASAQSLDIASVQADFGFFKDYLAVLGQAVITDLTVTNNFSTASITSPTGSLNLLAGLMVLDQSGNVAINGNLIVNGEVLAQKVTAPQGHFDELLAQKLEVDEAKIKSLTTDSLIIAGDASASAQTATGSASIATNATAGKATLPAGSTELTINSPHITAETLIYVTPIGDSQNQVLYVKSKQTCPGSELPESSEPNCSPWFKVAINQSLPFDLEFNWWIIKLE